MTLETEDLIASIVRHIPPLSSPVSRRSAWRPPARAWHELWQSGSQRWDLPIGLLSPQCDYLWRLLRESPVFCSPADAARLCGRSRQDTRSYIRSMVARGCAYRQELGGSTSAYRVERRHRMERTTDYIDRDRSRVEYLAVVPQTPMARHLRQIQQQPTPDPPPGLTAGQQRLWNVLAAHAVGRAALLPLPAAARLLGIQRDTLRVTWRTMRDRGQITRLYGCQQTVFRLSASAGRLC